MTYTAKQIEDAVDAAFEDGSVVESWQEIKWETDNARALDITIDDVTLPVIKIEDFGGEGRGDDYWVVIQVGEQYFQMSGYYTSHSGGDFDGGLEEVRPVQKTITVYESAR